MPEGHGPQEYAPAPAALAAAVRGATDHLASGRLGALAGMADPDRARLQARAARQAAVADLDASLARFEASARRAGTQVHHAVDAAAARTCVAGILDAAGARRLVKSKSMACEEIELRAHLEAGGREVVESDLGEWLVQLAGQGPSHIITPAIHLTLPRIHALLSAVAGRELPAETEALAAFARAHLRQKFLEADAGISGGNLLVCETGTVMIVSNEGNARMGTTLPRIHVAVVGVEKVVRGWRDALAVLAVLPRSATGQRITQYVSWLSGPRRAGDPPGDGPDEVHVVLLDNGRRRLVGTPAEELLYCIRCGACLNVCPVFRTMGGHAYGTVYPGPIGAALTPRLTQGREGADLPWASSLCGACREACPVGIQLDDQLIALRSEYPKAAGERVAMRVFAAAAGRPAAFAIALRVARVVTRGRPFERLPGPLSGWTRSRALRGLGPARRLRRLAPGAGARTPAASGGAPGNERGREPTAASVTGQAGSAAPRAPEPAPGVAVGGHGGLGEAEPAGLAQAASTTAGPESAGQAVTQSVRTPAPEAGLAGTFAARWRDNGGTAILTDPGGLAEAVRTAVGPGPVSADASLAAWVSEVPPAGYREAQVGLVRAEAGAAETGTLVLRSGAHTERGRSLLPPRVVFVLDAAWLRPDLSGAFAALDLLDPGDRPTGVTLVSGPSRSADIAQTLVIGVHGPGDARVIVVQAD